jgi:hypothetical protein
VVCDTRASNRESHEKRVEAIRNLIDSGPVSSKTRTEGGSGFLKLAAEVTQSVRGNITFGYTDEGRFQLAVTYPLMKVVRRELAVAA